MPSKRILEYPREEALLRKKSQPVRAFNRYIKNIIRDLKDTLKERPEGVGLAAVQINVHMQIFVVQLGAKPESEEKTGPVITIINPEIIEERSGDKGFDGCLSLPGLFGDTVRPHYLHVKGLNEWGKPFEQVFEGFDAVVIHHEIDHLNGVLFIDRITDSADLFTVKEDDDGKLIRVPVTIKK
jgi:peptide deformylase